jgi:hypothetical protein
VLKYILWVDCAGIILYSSKTGNRSDTFLYPKGLIKAYVEKCIIFAQYIFCEDNIQKLVSGLYDHRPGISGQYFPAPFVLRVVQGRIGAYINVLSATSP